MSFIENAKKLKKEKGYTTNELSKICGIPLGTLSKLFSGIIEEPKLSAAIAISKALDTTVDTLCEINNGTYTNEEQELLIKFRQLDEHGKNLTELIIKNELTRIGASENDTTKIAADKISSFQKKDSDFSSDNSDEKKEKPKPQTVITPTPAEFTIKQLPLYSTPVSAGTGEFLEQPAASMIRVKNTGKVAEASYALKVSGDSMMPEYSDGDILIVKEQSSVMEGELGIFVCDGQAYFKKFGGDRLISLNNDYNDLPLSEFMSSSCIGLVLGRLKTKKS